MMTKSCDELNKVVWATLKPSSIAGIGVFAIRDIPKGTTISDHTIESPGEVLYSSNGFYHLIPEIQDLILDRMLYEEGQFTFVFNPNCDAILRSFMNHSDNANTDGVITLVDIKRGEELTEDYSIYKIKGDVVTKNHLANFI